MKNKKINICYWVKGHLTEVQKGVYENPEKWNKNDVFEGVIEQAEFVKTNVCGPYVRPSEFYVITVRNPTKGTKKFVVNDETEGYIYAGVILQSKRKFKNLDLDNNIENLDERILAFDERIFKSIIGSKVRITPIYQAPDLYDVLNKRVFVDFKIDFV